MPPLDDEIDAVEVRGWSTQQLMEEHRRYCDLAGQPPTKDIAIANGQENHVPTDVFTSGAFFRINELIRQEMKRRGIEKER